MAIFFSPIATKDMEMATYVLLGVGFAISTSKNETGEMALGLLSWLGLMKSMNARYVRFFLLPNTRAASINY